LIIILALLISCSEDPVNPQPLPIVGPDSIRLSSGESLFLAGVNYPWLHYGHDYGIANNDSSTWGYWGINSTETKETVKEQLRFLAENKVSFLRVFLFCDGRATPEFDNNNNVIGIDSLFYSDFDTLLSIAKQNSIKLIVTLMDYLWLSDAKLYNGIKLYGKGDVITNELKRKTFLDNCLAPFISRYGFSPEIVAFELMNEPEWAIKELGGTNSKTSIHLTVMKDFFNDCIATIRQNSNVLITLGCADYKYLKYWRDIDLDFQTIHAYSMKANQPPFYLRADIEQDRKIVIGEFPTKSGVMNQYEYLNASWNYGYVGAFAWSLNGEDKYSDFDAESFKLWIDSKKIVF
jgi:hypothetical protein